MTDASLSRNKIHKRLPHFLAGAAIGAFVAWALGLLELPLFWDEIGVYGRGIFEMIDGKVSMHPDALPPDISRGHPLLFTYLIAGWARIFGDHVLALRAAALTVTVSLLLVSYFYLRRKGDPYSPLPLILMLLQPIFLAQSTLVLPEMMLALFTVIAVGAYLRDHLVIYFLAGSAMILTKETGIILVGGFSAFHFLYVLISRKQWIQTRFLVYLLPVIPYGIFLLVQKQTHGWYLFPYHVGGFNFAGPAIEKNLKDFLSFMFWEQGRYLWLILAGVIGASSLLQKPWRRNTDESAPRLHHLILFLCLVYLAFYSTTYYMNRYILVILVLLAVVLGRELWFRMQAALSQKALYVLLPLVIGMFAVQVQCLQSDHFTYDEDMAYKPYIEAQKQAIDYFVELNMDVEGFHVGFPLDFALLDHRYGYLPDSYEKMLNYHVKEDTRNILTIDPPGLINNPDKRPTELVKSWTHEYVEIRHYVVVDSLNTTP